MYIIFQVRSTYYSCYTSVVNVNLGRLWTSHTHVFMFKYRKNMEKIWQLITFAYTYYDCGHCNQSCNQLICYWSKAVLFVLPQLVTPSTLSLFLLQPCRSPALWLILSLRSYIMIPENLSSFIDFAVKPQTQIHSI